VSPEAAGHEYELVHGSQRAVVVEVGAGLRSYRAGGRDIVDGYRRQQPCDGGRGQLLIPWPNRIAGGRYRFDGRDLQLAIDDPRTGSAIHGLTRAMAWSLTDSSPDRCTLTLDLQAHDGYPFRLGLEARYDLGAHGLQVRITAVNRGDAACPYGAGAHPYVHVGDGALIDAAWLHVPARATLETDTRGIPTGVEAPVETTAFDFRVPRRIGSLVLDTPFTHLDRGDEGLARISLTAATHDHGVVVWMDRSLPYAMIYSGDTLADVPRRRRGIAIEPMTCAPDAFNSGAGLILLQPGASHTSTWGIAPLQDEDEVAAAVSVARSGRGRSDADGLLAR
jgi:galactose mutarotase-like enzyme